VDEARAMADAVVARAPDDADAMLLAASARDAGGDHAGARQVLEQALRAAPMRVDVLKFLGDVARRDADLEAAVACYRNALAIDDGYASVRLELARVHAERREDDQAERELLAAIDSVPSYADAIVELARLRLRLERGADALPPLIELLERDSYHFDALMALGDALLQMGNRDDAAIAYGRVLRFDPSHAAAQQALALLRDRRVLALTGVA